VTAQAWGLAAGVTDAASFPVYAAGVRWFGRKPGRVGWVMYGLFYAYIAAAQASAGATWSNLITVTEAAGCVWIAVLSVRHGEDDLTRRPGDGWWMLPARNPVMALCFGWLLAACAVWPLVAPATRLWLIVSVDGLATWQVVRYAARHGGESPGSWGLYALGCALSAGAVTQPWPSILYLYPVAGTVFGTSVLCALWSHAQDVREVRPRGRHERVRA